MGAHAPQASVVAESRRVLATHGRTFRLASHLLPAGCRDDAAVVYAFCRLVDDLADEASDHDAALDDLAQVVGMLRGQRRATPLVAAYVAVCERRGVPLLVAEDLIAGVVGDLGPVELADDQDLLRYGYRVAGTVGLMMSGVLGVVDPEARAHAVDLGVAMQITNICRDVAADATLGRVYLPAERLQAAGVEPAELLAGTMDRRATAGVVRDLLQLAERYYASGEAGFAYLPARARAAIAVAARVYRAIGSELRRQGFDPFCGRAVVPAHRRIAHALTACASVASRGVAGRLESARRLGHDRSLHVPLAGLLISPSRDGVA